MTPAFCFFTERLTLTCDSRFAPAIHASNAPFIKMGMNRCRSGREACSRVDSVIRARHRDLFADTGEQEVRAQKTNKARLFVARR